MATLEILDRADVQTIIEDSQHDIAESVVNSHEFDEQVKICIDQYEFGDRVDAIVNEWADANLDDKLRDADFSTIDLSDALETAVNDAFGYGPSALADKFHELESQVENFDGGDHAHDDLRQDVDANVAQIEILRERVKDQDAALVEDKRRIEVLERHVHTLIEQSTDLERRVQAAERAADRQQSIVSLIRDLITAIAGK
jgi:hypothetical protein